MRLVMLCLGVFLSACGPVKANNVDAGNDAPACGGTVDSNGDCICPARFTAPECTSCASGWGGTDCTMFFDDFNRSAGAMGSDYADIQVALADDALIFNNRACGDVQAVALLDELVDSPRISASMQFDPGNAVGQEFNFVLSSDPDLASLNNLILAGCDGGGGICNMKIGAPNSAPLGEQSLSAVIPSGTLTRATLSIDGSANIRLEVTLNGTPEVLTATMPAGFVVQRFGFIVGREPDGTLSCVDDLSLQVN